MDTRLRAGVGQSLLGIAALYAGKLSGVLTVILFLPLFQSALGVEQFGWAAAVFALQALAVMVDLGLATVVGREAAGLSRGDVPLAALLRRAEASLTALYGLLALAATGIMVVDFPVAALPLAIVVQLWALVLQNLYFSVGVAQRDYVRAGAANAGGHLLRSLATVFVLHFVSATFHAFVWTQLFCVLIHAYFTRVLLRMQFDAKMPAPRVSLVDLKQFLGKVRSPFVAAAAGAASTQLDKIILLYLDSPSKVTPYFLAMSASMVPISLLGGPVSQYFQPRVIGRVDSGDHQGTLHTLRQFSASLTVVVMVPTILLWIARDHVVAAWLRDDALTRIVSDYMSVLLPAAGLGALGFIPYSLVLAARDYAGQAVISSSLTVLLLAILVAAALQQDVRSMCWAYLGFHVLSTVIPWLRSSRNALVTVYARHSAAMVARNLLLILACAAVLMAAVVLLS